MLCAHANREVLSKQLHSLSNSSRMKAKEKEKEQTPFMLRNSVGLIQLAHLLTSTF